MIAINRDWLLSFGFKITHTHTLIRKKALILFIKVKCIRMYICEMKSLLLNCARKSAIS